jgi:hypothetical protein
MKHVRFVILVPVAIVMACLMMGLWTKPALAQAPDPTANVSNRDLVGALMVPRPWTAAEMQAAIPYPLPQREGGPTAAVVPEPPAGEPGFIPARPPEGSTLLPRPRGSTGPAVGMAAAGEGFGYPPPFDRYAPYALPRNVFPFVAVGRLFFVREGVRYSCSAASIGNFAVWTAGHCLHDGASGDAGWSQNVVFVPAYHNGRAPLGQWPAAVLWTKQGWFADGDLRYDMGGAVLRRLGGRKISQRVGALGFAWNQGFKVHWYAVGYPAVAPFDGRRQFLCSASFATADPALGVPAPVAMGCDLTGGISGGPWLLAFTPSGDGNYLNGNFSYGYTEEPLQVYSPYFDDAAKSLYDVLIGAMP